MDSAYIKTYSQAISTNHEKELKSIQHLKESFVELQKDS